MPSLRTSAALAVLCVACAGCVPLTVKPVGLTGGAGVPQGATFFADPAPELPTWPDAPASPLKREPSLTGTERCGGDAGEKARAQCLRGGGGGETMFGG